MPARATAPASSPLDRYVGRALPAVELIGTSGRKERVLRDEPTLVVFTGPWSLGSLQTQRALVGLTARLGRPLAMVLVDLADLADASTPAALDGFRVVANPTGEVRLLEPWQQASNPYAPNSIFLVDRAGVLQRVFAGGKDACVPCEPSFEPAVRAFLGP